MNSYQDKLTGTKNVLDEWRESDENQEEDKEANNGGK